MFSVFIDGRNGTTGLKIYDRLAQRDDLTFIVLSEEDRKDPKKRAQALNDCDAAFLCLPDTAAIEAVEMIRNPAVTVFDTSTAHRTNPGWAYGFPELSEGHMCNVLTANRIAVPGCHASGFIALVRPLVDAGVLDAGALLTATSLTGYSGGGKKMIAQYEAAERDIALDSPRQYGLTQAHKHLPEMVNETGLQNAPAFLPIVASFFSGMQVTVALHASMVNASADAIKAIYREKYSGEIVFYRENMHADGFAPANAMAGKDSMAISVAGNGERILLMAEYDNLGKGASGAAIELMNLRLGMDTAKGLTL